MDVRPLSERLTVAEQDLSRTYLRQTFDSEVQLYTFSAGPEFDVVQSRFLDVSLEAGVMAFVYARNDGRTEREERYTLFAPEVLAPDSNSAQLRELVEERSGPVDHMSGGRQYGKFQAYLGARVELYPVQVAGIGAQLRWHALNAPLTNTYYPLFGSYDVSYEAHHWTLNFYVSLATNKTRHERR
jgi:hypothetical protein